MRKPAGTSNAGIIGGTPHPRAASAREPGRRCAHAQAFLMAIFFSLFWASGRFGKVTVSTPFL
jgi:hypothetical protein